MEWKRFDDFYEVSSTGDVRKSASKVLIKKFLNDQGYFIVRLSNPRRSERVHRMVAFCFCVNPNKLPFVNHLDSNRSNNNFSNLEWCTQKQNIEHAEKLGRMQRNYWVGKRSPNAKLTDETALKIKQIYLKGGVTYEKLAKEFGVSKRTVGRIVDGENYRPIPPPPSA